MAKKTKKTLAVYTIVDIGGEKPLWNRIGSAFVNKDGSINVLLNALPLDGKLHIREANGNGNGESKKG